MSQFRFKARRTGVAMAFVALTFLAGPSLRAEASAGLDWPQFRGPERNGISAETGFLDAWPESGPQELWRQPIGEGYSAISVVGDKLYTMFSAEIDGTAKELAASMDASSGEVLWQTVVGDKLDTEFGNGPRATPTVDADQVFVLGSYGDLAALERASGKVQWTFNLKERYGSEQPTWGFSTSPLVDGDRLVIETGGPEGKSYAALDRKTGAEIWVSGTGGRQPGYSSPLKVSMNGEPRYVYVAGGKLRCIDENGIEVWQHEWPRGETHAMPLFIAPNRIFASGAQGVGGALFAVTEKDGKGGVEELWKQPLMRNHFSSSVIHDGHIFGFDNATLKAIAIDSSDLAWAKRGLGKGSLVLVDGHLLVLTDRGKLLWLDASSDAYSEKGAVQALDGKSWTAPVVAHGVVYLRNHSEIVAYRLKG